MATSASMFLLADSVAQFGIEGRRIGSDIEREGDEPVPKWDVSALVQWTGDGGLVFAPLSHAWLGLVDRVRLTTQLRTLGARLALDQLIWGPFIVGVFWGSNGVLEGKSPAQVQEKVEHAFVSSYIKSLCVFGPTQVINFAFVPLHHRLAVQQTVGLGWNIWLSYINNVNNRILARASADLALAQADEAAQAAAHPEEKVSHAHVERAEHAVEKALSRRERIRGAEGGGATGVGTRMGF
ncbi:hypothetical protein VHUM_01929 [Vanrija humicola]|uniref:Uncharacterized protein n=1 Tax=Vanrija humicola TaxID=5417 RepID=A0A7D8YXN4_VANHU|nr:hypothetical protein VHUM_01929 [Vanrija humicola]